MTSLIPLSSASSSSFSSPASSSALASSSLPDIDDIDKADDEVLFHADLLEMVKAFYQHDKSRGENPSKKLVEFVKSAPRHGITNTLRELKETLLSIYATHRTDVLEGFDDWIFKPTPILLKVNRKIYLPIGSIYTRVSEKDQDELHCALVKTFIHLVSDKSDKAKLQAFVGTKEKKAPGGFGGLGNIGEMLAGLMGGAGEGQEGISSIMTEIMDKLKGSAMNPDDPSTIDPNAIGNLVKGLITDKSEDGLASRLTNNPTLASFAEKLKGSQMPGAK